MDVSAKTIREVEFREKLRGYNPDDVDTFLERVAAGIDLLHDRLRQVTDRAERAERRAEESVGGDDALRRTLVLAQRTADLAITEAREQAVAIVEEAKSQAAAIVVDARQQMYQAKLDAERELRLELDDLRRSRDLLQDDIHTLDRYLDAERQRLRLALGEAIRWIDTSMPSLVPSPPLNDPHIPPPPPDPLTAEMASGSQEAEPEGTDGAVDPATTDAIDLDRFSSGGGRHEAAGATIHREPAQTEETAAR